MITALQTVCLP